MSLRKTICIDMDALYAAVELRDDRRYVGSQWRLAAPKRAAWSRLPAMRRAPSV